MGLLMPRSTVHLSSPQKIPTLQIQNMVQRPANLQVNVQRLVSMLVEIGTKNREGKAYKVRPALSHQSDVDELDMKNPNLIVAFIIGGVALLGTLTGC